MPAQLVARCCLANAGVVLAVLCAAAWPLDAAPSASAQRKDQAISMVQLTGTLRSGSWAERDAALKVLSQVPANQGDRLWDALVAALDAENKFVLSGANNRDENYSEYYGRLIGAVLFWMSPSRIDSRSATVLVNAIYDSDSRYAQALGSMGRGNLSAAAEQCAATARVFRRAGCLGVIGWILRADNKAAEAQERLKPSQRYALLRTLRVEVVGSSDELGQIAAVDALVVAEDVESIPMLETLEGAERGRLDGRRYLLSAVERALKVLRGRFH